MGTDDLGRDLLTRVLHGGRISLTVGLMATLTGVGLGTLLGALAGLQGGWVDNGVMRLTDVFLALPRIFVLILMTVFLRSLDADWARAGGGVPGIIVVLALLSWMGVARQVRSQLLVLKEQEYILAARGLGLRQVTIVCRHLLPNALTPVIVAASLRVAGAIMAESGLSFLGFWGAAPDPHLGQSADQRPGRNVERAPLARGFSGHHDFSNSHFREFFGGCLAGLSGPAQAGLIGRQQARKILPMGRQPWYRAHAAHTKRKLRSGYSHYNSPGQYPVSRFCAVGTTKS